MSEVNIPPVRILEYRPLQPGFLPYDPAFPLVAESLIAAISALGPTLEVHHIGSSAIPGCGGKGYVDLMVLYEPEGLEGARVALRSLGFQSQGGRDPWPESRPMRVGMVEHGGRFYRVHAHVIARDATEVEALLRFRDLLRQDPALVRRYEVEKQRLLRAGVLDGADYAERKGSFIRGVTGQDG